MTNSAALDQGVEQIAKLLEIEGAKVMIIGVMLEPCDEENQVVITHKGYHSPLGNEEIAAMMVGVHNQLSDFFKRAAA